MPTTKKTSISEPREKAPGASARVKIRTLPTGVSGLDEILGGGIPEFSFNLIGGHPGCGKTTLAHQIAFANATPKKPALYFTVLGETVMKMMRYQQQYSFFDATRLGKDIRFSNLSDMVLERDLDKLLDQVIKEVTESNPGIVVVDSFRTLVRESIGEADQIKMQSFIHRLAEFLINWEATTFLLGEYAEEDILDDPIFTLVDGIFWLSQVAERNSVVRKLQLVKLRGQASVPGLHTVRITSDGLEAFSRTLGLFGKRTPLARHRRLSIGIPDLDKMLDGGILEGDSLLVAGPSGTGKSAIATQFIAEGLKNGEPGIMAIFEERPQGYTQRAGAFGLKLKAAQRKGLLETLYLRPLDLSVDETMHDILDAIKRVGATRLVIDSLVGFEMALAPSFRADFRESLYRMIGALTGSGVTILSTVEVEDTFTGFPFSNYAISFLTDDIIRLRYVEIDGQLRKVVMVVKMRGSNHSKDIREYVITDKGVVVIRPRRTDYNGLTTGIPTMTGPRAAQETETAPEAKATR
jgi:circadian clock protein KaiC